MPVNSIRYEYRHLHQYRRMHTHKFLPLTYCHKQSWAHTELTYIHMYVLTYVRTVYRVVNTHVLSLQVLGLQRPFAMKVEPATQDTWKYGHLHKLDIRLWSQILLHWHVHMWYLQTKDTSVFWNQDRHFYSHWVIPRQNHLCIVDTGQGDKL